MSANDEVHPDGVGAAASRPGGTIPTDVAPSTVTGGASPEEHGQAAAGPQPVEPAGVPATAEDARAAGPDVTGTARSAEATGLESVSDGPNGVANGHEQVSDAGGQELTGEPNGEVEEHLGVGTPYPATARQPQPPRPPQAPRPPAPQPARAATASTPSTTGQLPAVNGQAWRPAERPAERPVPGRAAPGAAAQQQAAWSSRTDGTPPSSPAARRRGGESPLTEWQSSPPNVARRGAQNQAAQAAASGPQQPAAQPQAGGQQGPTPGGAAYAGGASAAGTAGQSGLGEQNPWEEDPIGEQARRLAPRYGVRGAIYRITKLNLGPTRRDLDELEIRERLNRQTRRTRGYCGYIGISSEKGGVGKTTLASLLAAEIAEGRRESVGIADLNPDLGTLPDRFGVRPHYSIRDLLAHVDEIPWRYHVHDFMEKVPEMNVRVLAASTDRKIRHQLSMADVELLAELFAPFFSFAIFDNGTHITHEAMLGTLRTAHGLVLVTDNTRDGANLARKTLQFLTDNGFPDMRRRAVVAVVAKETASPIKVRAIEKAFRDHVRDLVVVPYDAALDGGGKIPFRDPNAVNKLLRKETRMAVRRLAAIVMDDLVS